MENKNAPYKGLNTEKNNGLTDTQEVRYSEEFKNAYKAEQQDSKEQSEKNSEE